MYRKLISVFLVIVASLGIVLYLVYPNTISAQSLAYITAKYINDREIQVDYPMDGVQINLKSQAPQTPGYETYNINNYVIKKGEFGATKDCGAKIAASVIGSSLALTVTGVSFQRNIDGGMIDACPSLTANSMNARTVVNRDNRDTPVPDTVETRVINVTVLIKNNGSLSDAGGEYVDLALAPAEDSIGISENKNLIGPPAPNGGETKTASRELSGANVAYRTTFSKTAGVYEICSKNVAKNKCVTVTKISGKIENVVIEADAGVYDIIKDGQNANAEEESCTQRTVLSAGWIVCGALELLSDGMNSMMGYVEDLLNVDMIKLDKDKNGGLFKAWSSFRYIATILLIGVALVMILSQAIGGGN